MFSCGCMIDGGQSERQGVGARYGYRWCAQDAKTSFMRTRRESVSSHPYHVPPFLVVWFWSVAAVVKSLTSGIVSAAPTPSQEAEAEPRSTQAFDRSACHANRSCPPLPCVFLNSSASSRLCRRQGCWCDSACFRCWRTETASRRMDAESEREVEDEEHFWHGETASMCLTIGKEANPGDRII